MKMKTNDLTGGALDYAVCLAEGLKPEDIHVSNFGGGLVSIYRYTRDEDGKLDGRYMTGPDLLFSRKWEAGGPIIDREKINLNHSDDGLWYATIDPYEAVIWTRAVGDSPSALTAAMRCYVASKLGEEVTLPASLK